MIKTRLKLLKQKDTRRLIAVILGGKMLGIGALLAANRTDVSVLEELYLVTLSRLPLHLNRATPSVPT